MVVLMLKISVATVLFRWLFRIVVDKPVLMAVAVGCGKKADFF